MKTLLTLIGGVTLALALNQTAHVKGWRGIVPLRSTRAEVVALLGQPNLQDGRYDLKNEIVDIIYSFRRCAGGAEWNVTPATVVGVKVTPKGGLKLSDLAINLGDYEKHAGPLYARYSNKREGIRYETVKPDEQVLEIYYGPTAEDEKLRCPNWQRPPACKTVHDPCPFAYIDEEGGVCPSATRRLDASIAGLAPDDALTFTWTVSAGFIVGGQGTSSVTVDTTGSGGKPVVARLKVAIIECEVCDIEESYTIEPCPKSKPEKSGVRKP